MECSLYLARLLLACGESAAASDMLQQLDADIEQHQLTLPDTQAQQLSLLLSKAALHLQLGQRDAFAASLLPQFTELIDQAENNAAVVAAAKKVGLPPSWKQPTESAHVTRQSVLSSTLPRCKR